jgi:2-polyprenyl-6-methoxyphenol hydroxylase-like FAD-dependent oxidoreductase
MIVAKASSHSVIIVGAGPVGLGLACELGQRGIDCLLIERRDGCPCSKIVLTAVG